MLEDPELQRAFAAREGWAYDAAYRVYGRILSAAARSVLRADSDVQDCVHDVLLRLWRRGNAYRLERGSLCAFLAVSVRNEALTRARNARNRDRIVRSVAEPIDEPDVGDAVAQRESVRAAMRALTDKQRRSIELAYFGGLTHEQIARELDEPVGTVKSRLSASLRRLRDVFTREETTHA